MSLPRAAINALYPAANAKSVTPSDSTTLAGGVTKALYIGTGGNIAVVMVGDGDTSHATVFTGVLGGTILPVQAVRVNNTSTTASNIVAMY